MGKKKENVGEIINAHTLGKALLDIKPKAWSLKSNDKLTKIKMFVLKKWH